MKTWKELTSTPLMKEERVILQLLATATTHPAFSHLTPEEVLKWHVKWAVKEEPHASG